MRFYFMSLRIPLRLLSLLSFALCLLPRAARAQVIDFEALQHNDTQIVNHGSSYTEDGFTVTGRNLSSYGTQESRFPGSTSLFSNSIDGTITLSKPES